MLDSPGVIGTSRGVPVADELVERLAEEAERGYDPGKLRLRSHPRLGSDLSEIVPVRRDPDLRRALEARAADEHTTQSDLVGRALRAFLA